ncbi:hypothetical protein FSP39_007031 [Pinctada imbricata]|uniref:Uncharacterized protein n=1 Tax=Pinctada imbricata TaxID=66713 RepID=A0AA88YKK8_PINIB|nr:hypothetical protein FSP39_007031 [Pinctada imbricata]
MTPWLINTLIDEENFDEVITDPVENKKGFYSYNGHNKDGNQENAEDEQIHVVI